MNGSKINLWAIGAVMVLAGSVLVYFLEYKNNEWFSVLSFGPIFLGWFALFFKGANSAAINATAVHFKEDKMAWLKQRAFNIGLLVLVMVMIYANFFYVSGLSRQRKNDILAHQPTKTTTAVVSYIYARKAKSAITYFAIFDYTANGQPATFPWQEDKEGDFKAGDKYEIKYSVEYPDMIVLVRKE